MDSVREDDLSKLKEGKNGNILAPFGNGFYQQVSFLDVTVRDRGQPAPRQKPVSPDVQPQKVNAFLTNELIVGKAIWDRKTADAAAAVFNQVESPETVDFFSTDCVSCHVASSARDLFYKETPLVIKHKIIPGTEFLTPYFSDPNFLDFSTDAFQRASFTNGFRSAPLYTNIVDGFTRSQPKEIVAATLINFGYRGAKPQVSPRTANESALVAETANRFLNNGAPPAPSCPIEPLRQCLLTTEMVKLNQSSGFMISHCLRQLCPERLASVRSVFGDDVSHRYRLKADVAVVGSSSKFAWNLEKNPAVLKKGSVVYGRVEQDPWSPEKFTLLTPDVLSVERQGAQTAYMRSAAGCFFEATDANSFERLE